MTAPIILEKRPEDQLADIQTAPEKKISVVSAGALVSVIVPCCGMIEYTKLCMPSLLKYTRAPFELILLDIGSLDGTSEYLAGIKAASKFRVEIVRTATDLAIADACREAVSRARGDYFVLLNNDTVLTEGWLHQLINLANLSPALGMTGPMSNYAPPAQLVELIPYRARPKKRTSNGRVSVEEVFVDMDVINAFARDFREKAKGKWSEVDRLAGFCLLVKRQVLDKVGLPNLEKVSELSLFDTDQLSDKARQAGFTLGCCRDLFVHHFGTRTFSAGAPTAENDATRTN